MKLEHGTIAVVTGAGSGIGLALADALARAGCSLVLADVQEDALTAAATQIEAHGVETLTRLTDVSNVAEIESLAAETLERFGRVNVLCNNAGVAAKADPWLGPIESWEWTLGVNFWGVVHGIRAFLPHIVMSGGGHIVNTASIAGLMPGFGPAYDASKHAVVAITETLYHNMRAGGLPVGVSCLCPGWVKTSIIDSERNWPSQLGMVPELDAIQDITIGHVRRAIDEGMPPAAVADKVVDAISSDRFWVFPQREFLELAIARFHQIADEADPVQPEQVPGMPPMADIMAEVAALMTPPDADG